MEAKGIGKNLNQLIGHLKVESRDERRQLDTLVSSLAKTAQDPKRFRVSGPTGFIEDSDLYFDDRIDSARLQQIDRISKRLESDEEPQFKVFRRELSVKANFLPQGASDWSAGARVDHSVGPFQGVDGRSFWFDFFRIEKLVALYIQGKSQPALLFKTRSAGRASTLTNVSDLQLRIKRSKTYTLGTGSIWINSIYLAPDAPADTFVGLTLNGGSIKLSSTPQTVNDKLKVPASTVITLDLDLSQPEPEMDEQAPYGEAARQMQLNLPDKLEFHFSGNGRTIDHVADAQIEAYGQSLETTFNANTQPFFNQPLQRVVFPLSSSTQSWTMDSPEAPFNTLSGQATVSTVGWALAVSTVDIDAPVEASGIGGLVLQLQQGIHTQWKALKNGPLALQQPQLIAEPGQLLWTDMHLGNGHPEHELHLWQDEQNPIGSRALLHFAKAGNFYYLSNGTGSELLAALTNATLEIDRPCQVDGYAPRVRTLDSLFVLSATSTARQVFLFDFNLIADDSNIDNEDPIIPERLAFALTNALFKVTEPNSCLLFGSLDPDFLKMESGSLYLGYGMYEYIPTLPDPYAARLADCPRATNSTTGAASASTGNEIKGLLLSLVRWSPPQDDSSFDRVVVSFHFVPNSLRFLCRSLQPAPRDPDGSTPSIAADSSIRPLNFTNSSISGLAGEDHEVAFALRSASRESKARDLPDYGSQWEKGTARYERDIFALLDVSTNADLFGISFDLIHRSRFQVDQRTNAQGEAVVSFYPVQVQGMDVISPGANVKAFTVPQISWEPVFNLTPPAPVAGDPDAGFNYYPDDGGPSHILNNSTDAVALAPLPLTQFLLEKRASEEDFKAFSFFTLPFGMRAAALLAQNYTYQGANRDGGDLSRDTVSFENNMESGLHLRMDAGAPFREGDTKMFMGSTVQTNNILNIFGAPTGDSTLGGSVTEIFNSEFFNDPNYPFELFKQRGVPLTRLDLSGYGASSFSNWFNTKAAIAETSQAKFDIFVGRCSHEIIQVKSILYPWAIRVVRTITLFRVGSGYVYRFDTGWRAESDGKFDFRYHVFDDNPEYDPMNPDPENPQPLLVAVEKESPLDIHPGLIRALYNVSNIVETGEIEAFNTTATFNPHLDPDGKEVDSPKELLVNLQPVFFDADIDIDHLTAGGVKKNTNDGQKEVVPSKRILGFVQLGPRGLPLNPIALRQLVQRQGSIGGPIDCEVNLANSDQKMRLSRFDFNNSFGSDGSSPIFSVAGRGNVLLPREGSWSMVLHERGTGEVTPVPANLGIPVIREGKIIANGDDVTLEKPVGDVLTRMANPTELLRNPVESTINYGILQSTDTQKALILTPSFKLGTQKLLSKTPPLFVDAFRIVNTKSIFPNIGAGDNFSLETLGEAIIMKKGGSIPFSTSDLQDLGENVLELMDVQDTLNGVAQQGLQLIHNLATYPEKVFDLPTEFNLIDLGDDFRIYIEYDKKNSEGQTEAFGGLDFDINSVAENWKSKMNNIGIVIDLAGIPRLMTIRGNWDSENGKEATYPQPDIKFSPELQPLVDLLEILESLQSENYGDVVEKGLQLAMSNKANSWEYKFEASKEIPVIRFPFPDALYNDPNAPFKLEAGLRLGAYFNAALKIPNDANDLLPSAGGFLGFYARLSVMCVSISAATIYAIGQANVDIAVDTQIGPSLLMKFGFGAQIVIGLPVAGNVSVLFVVGAEIFIASTEVKVTAFLLFEGHAEILGGIVAITITIEAQGTYAKKQLGNGQSRTDLQCQVTFGLDISIAFIINISFSTSWSEQRQIA
ncbi:hypothetical protein [Croceiramulus getboli]|nr:hypothetical protein P8624_01875 [Flavobacteriaceae bacterium YJPT1-3]